MSRRLTRRELAGLCGAGVLSCRAGSGRTEPRPSRPGVVALAEAPPFGVEITAASARSAMGRALAAATGLEGADRAARSLFAPEDTVGIKLNCLAGPGLSPRVEVVEALVELIASAGVNRQRIIVFERSSRELERAGFEIRRSGGPYLCFGVDNDYQRLPTVSGEIGSCFARLATERCTALVLSLIHI